MMAIRARLIAIIVGAIAAALTTWFGIEVTEEWTNVLTRFVTEAFSVALLLWYAVIHPWIQKRFNPTGAMTKEAANKLETFAHVQKV